MLPMDARCVSEETFDTARAVQKRCDSQAADVSEPPTHPQSAAIRLYADLGEPDLFPLRDGLDDEPGRVGVAPDDRDPEGLCLLVAVGVDARRDGEGDEGRLVARDVVLAAVLHLAAGPRLALVQPGERERGRAVSLEVPDNEERERVGSRTARSRRTRAARRRKQQRGTGSGSPTRTRGSRGREREQRAEERSSSAAAGARGAWPGGQWGLCEVVPSVCAHHRLAVGWEHERKHAGPQEAPPRPPRGSRPTRAKVQQRAATAVRVARSTARLERESWGDNLSPRALLRLHSAPAPSPSTFEIRTRPPSRSTPVPAARSREPPRESILTTRPAARPCASWSRRAGVPQSAVRGTERGRADLHPENLLIAGSCSASPFPSPGPGPGP